MKQTLIVAYFADRTLGWSHVDGQPFFQGDSEWEESARQASEDKQYISLYEGNVEGVADIDDPENLKGVFLALAALPAERIRIAACPDGMLEGLGLSLREIDPDDEDQEDTESPFVPLNFSREEFLNDALKYI